MTIGSNFNYPADARNIIIEKSALARVNGQLYSPTHPTYVLTTAPWWNKSTVLPKPLSRFTKYAL